jgi:hypothetical protein
MDPSLSGEGFISFRAFIFNSASIVALIFVTYTPTHTRQKKPPFLRGTIYVPYPPFTTFIFFSLRLMRETCMSRFVLSLSFSSFRRKTSRKKNECGKTRNAEKNNNNNK